jgi:hypothetical protein
VTVRYASAISMEWINCGASSDKLNHSQVVVPQSTSIVDGHSTIDLWLESVLLPSSDFIADLDDIHKSHAS